MYENLPGGDILDHDLEAMRSGVVNESSLLLLIAARRLGECGIKVAPLDIGGAFPEDRLYDLLVAQHGAQAYRLYRSLIRRLISLENAPDGIHRVDQRLVV
jgi:hypothetical protein